MQQEATTLQNLIQHRKSEVQAVQRKLDNLQTAFDRATAQLTKKQSALIEKSLTTVRAVLTQDTTKLQELQTAKTELVQQISETRGQLDDLTEAIKTATQDLTKTKSSHDSTLEAIKTAKDDLDRVLIIQRDTELHISAMANTKQTLQEETEAMQDELKSLHDKSTVLEQAYTKRTDDKKASIAKLDAQLLESTQRIEAIRQEELVLRASMAAWQKSLEARDKGLRIREQKVELGETKLIQNSSLLDL